jgi:hypothetical protein
VALYKTSWANFRVHNNVLSAIALIFIAFEHNPRNQNAFSSKTFTRDPNAPKTRQKRANVTENDSKQLEHNTNTSTTFHFAYTIDSRER